MKLIAPASPIAVWSMHCITFDKEPRVKTASYLKAESGTVNNRDHCHYIEVAVCLPSWLLCTQSIHFSTGLASQISLAKYSMTAL